MNPKKFRGWCLNGCGNEIKIGATKYCSIRCEHDFGYRKRVAALESGSYKVKGPSSFLRRYLVRRFGERCTRCGWNERHPITKKIPIEIEHIDGNWENNLPSNLTLLCPNCHSLTPTYRALNWGRGRAWRTGNVKGVTWKRRNNG
jgi:hypothetical protein